MKSEYWINVYQSKDGTTIFGIPHRTIARAKDAISSGFMRLAYRIHVRLR